MSFFTAALLLAAALIAAGCGAMIRRRSLPGVAIGFVICLAGALVLAVSLLGLTGVASSLALVAAMAIVALATASAVIVAAVHVAMARASSTERGLEPW